MDNGYGVDLHRLRVYRSVYGWQITTSSWGRMELCVLVQFVELLIVSIVGN
jgi:hypothetical protein